MSCGNPSCCGRYARLDDEVWEAERALEDFDDDFNETWGHKTVPTDRRGAAMHALKRKALVAKLVAAKKKLNDLLIADKKKEIERLEVETSAACAL